MKTASKLLVASTTSVLLATAAASSGSGAVQTVTTTKAHPGHSATASPRATRRPRSS